MAAIQQLLMADVPASGSYDTDAQAFFTAAGITDSTQKSAVNQLVLDLKSASIWTKMTALYPFVGGDATKHSYNLKNTANFQITWNGTVTHNANGITGNGTTGYGDTGYNDNTSGTLNSFHLSLYSRSASVTGAMEEIGARATSFHAIRLAVGQTVNTLFCGCQDATLRSISNSDASGFFVLSRTASTDYRMQIRGTNNNFTQNSTVKPAQNIFIGALNGNGSATSFSNRNIALASIGSGLTQTEAAIFDTAVVAFQTTLSRNV